MKEIVKKRLSVEVGQDLEVTRLPENRNKGWPLLLGVKMDEQLQCLVEQMRANIVIGIGGEIVLK